MAREHQFVFFTLVCLVVGNIQGAPSIYRRDDSAKDLAALHAGLPTMDEVMVAIDQACEAKGIICDLNENFADFVAETLEDGQLKTVEEIVAASFGETNVRYTQQQTEAVPSVRKKRRVKASASKLWGKGLVAYEIDQNSPIVGSQLELLKGQMRAFEKHTCIQFFEYYDGIYTDKPDMKPGRILLGSYSGCWSGVGYNGGTQQTSPCPWPEEMMHELGHALGFIHEHQRMDRNTWFKAYPGTWGALNDAGDMFGTMKSYDYNVPYDLSSNMMGSLYKRGQNNKLRYRVHDSQTLSFAGNHPYGMTFLDWKSLNLAYKCYENYNCASQTINCTNGGYPTYADGACRCICPIGLTGADCGQVYQSAPQTAWPAGSYGIIAPSDTGCPSQGAFDAGQRVHGNNAGGTTLHPGTKITSQSSKTVFDFCVMKSGAGSGTFPPGTYCVLKAGDACPAGHPWDEGSLSLPAAGGETSNGTLPSGTFDAQETKLEFCCRFDTIGTMHAGINLPWTEPFYIFPAPGAGCQEIEGMIAEKHHIFFGISNAVKVEPIPSHHVFYGRIYLYICYYYPKKEVPGSVTTLDENNPETTIQSDGYPTNYVQGLESYWYFKGPEGSLIQLEFLDFDIPTNSLTHCTDKLDIQSYGTEMPAKSYCNFDNFVGKTVTSKTNEMMVRFLAKTSAGGKGFKAKVKVILPSQLCYKKHGDYRGTVSHTQTGFQCLNWNKVKKCAYNAMDTRSYGKGLEDNNYCRNPSGIGGNWCYYDEEDCLQDMCDPCLLDKCIDRYPDCMGMMSLYSQFCQTNPAAVIYCQKTCNLCRLPDQVVSCSAPPVFSGATYPATQKQTYQVGEEVEYQCTKSELNYTISCQSDGTWSHAASQCKGCEKGYDEFDGSCFKYYPSHQYSTFYQANLECITVNYDYHVASMSTIQRKEYFEKMARNARAADNVETCLFTGLKNNGTDWSYSNGSPVTLEDWQPWASGQVLTNDVIVDSSNHWRGASSSEKCGFFCEGKVDGAPACYDKRKDCQTFLQTHPDVCIQHTEYAYEYCSWSCGLCVDNSQASTPCTAPATVGNAQLLSLTSNLERGDTAIYDCNDGYSLFGGDLDRVCLADGTLAGDDPDCRLKSDLIWTVGKVIRKHPSDDTTNSANIAGDTVIPIDGFLHSWSFYSKNAEMLTLYVWRPTGTSGEFNLVGKNQVWTTREVAMNYMVPTANKIAVKKGDVIGWSSSSPILTYIGCTSQFIPNYTDTFYQVTNPGTFAVGSNYQFPLQANTCRNYSIQAVVGPAGANNELECALPHSAHAQCDHSQDSVPVGTSVTYSCLDSTLYELRNGDGNITCLSDGQWRGDPPSCVFTGCTVQQVSNGPSNESRTIVPKGTTVTYTCDSGYTANGQTDITCSTNGQWDADAPTCDQQTGSAAAGSQVVTTNGVPCVFPFTFQGVTYHACDGTPPFSWCATVANMDADMNAWGYCAIKCQLGGNVEKDPGNSWWDGCDKKFCNSDGTIGHIPRPYIEIPDKNTVCQFPFSLNNVWYGDCTGSPAWCSWDSVFEENYNWGVCDTNPPCTVPQLANGTSSVTGPQVPAGTSATMTCDSGFDASGNGQSSCQQDGLWSPAFTLQCTKKDDDVMTTDGQTCVFPFIFNGQSYSTCQGDHPWKWCATTANYDTDQQYGFCSYKCKLGGGVQKNVGESWMEGTDKKFCGADGTVMDIPHPNRKTKDGKDCVFPFLANYNWYGDCDDTATPSWCSLTTDFSQDYLWGECEDV